MNELFDKIYEQAELEREIKKLERTKTNLSNMPRLYYARTYGITESEYNHLYQEQERKCWICGIHQYNLDKKLHVDHDHKTGIVRDLLCSSWYRLMWV